MNVTELRAALEGLPGDMAIVLASDAEGNHESELVDVGVAWWYPDDLEPHTVHPDDVGEEYDEDELIRVVSLWP